MKAFILLKIPSFCHKKASFRHKTVHLDEQCQKVLILEDQHKARAREHDAYREQTQQEKQTLLDQIHALESCKLSPETITLLQASNQELQRTVLKLQQSEAAAEVRSCRPILAHDSITCRPLIAVSSA